jgi:hypothetical protein
MVTSIHVPQPGHASRISVPQASQKIAWPTSFLHFGHLGILNALLE